MEWKTIQAKPKAAETKSRAEKSSQDTAVHFSSKTEFQTNPETDIWRNSTVSVCTETELFNSNGRKMPDRTSQETREIVQPGSQGTL